MKYKFNHTTAGKAKNKSDNSNPAQILLYRKALGFDPRNAEAREGLERVQRLTAPAE